MEKLNEMCKANCVILRFGYFMRNSGIQRVTYVVSWWLENRNKSQNFIITVVIKAWKWENKVKPAPNSTIEKEINTQKMTGKTNNLYIV